MGPTTVSMEIWHLIIVENYLPNVNLWTFIQLNGNMMTLIEKHFFVVVKCCWWCQICYCFFGFVFLFFCFVFFTLHMKTIIHQTYLRPTNTKMHSIRWKQSCKTTTKKSLSQKKISQDSEQQKKTSTIDRKRWRDEKRKELNRLAMACENADKCMEEKKRPIQYKVACTVNPEWIHRMRGRERERTKQMKENRYRVNGTYE